MKQKNLVLSKVLATIASIALIGSLFVPLWSIYLDAPQYPEGLSLQIWANKIAGDVDIINGLNHYIGMKTLHTDDFIEFTLLPYIIIFFAILFIISAWMFGKKMLYTSFSLFLLFGIVSMIDFWKWEYDYGHNLDPNAAIKVPGMAYQPPLIGFKQLLNFGAFSIPDVGGWLFIVAGLLILVAVLNEMGFLNKILKGKKAMVFIVSFSIFISSCAPSGSVPIQLNNDACSSCKMSIADGHFASEVITKKGRVYKFDDISCLFHYLDELKAENVASYYVNDYNKENELIEATQAWFVNSEVLKSPMGGSIAAFQSKEDAAKLAKDLNVEVKDWKGIMP
ncbi:MAG TPA: nitrous oxide reductase accessory protein NosL [Chitinophagaceae bacterium]|nr:nitrous oxide reductase accessory protein NosL [Chitinophagaceae bacterium]